MEEDIKILEEAVMHEREEQEALENLIKGYRELEENHKKLSENPEWLKHYWIGRKEVDELWKSKIKEKIDKLEGLKELYIVNCQGYSLEICEGTIKQLQDLMEDK